MLKSEQFRLLRTSPENDAVDVIDEVTKTAALLHITDNKGPYVFMLPSQRQAFALAELSLASDRFSIGKTLLESTLRIVLCARTETYGFSSCVSFSKMLKLNR
ncbi:MAG: hypothetical protein K2X93_19945 [Candidatus Obscuribacterales bacterium]|nr:hypothetical protein [Candidatus Obscuribacterales bacterium]